MKAKGIKSITELNRIGGRAPAILLSVTLALSLAVLPLRAATPEDPASKKARSKIYREAKKALRSGKYEKAIEIYQELIDKYGQDIQARLGMALAYVKLQNYQFSYNHANEASKIDPNNARAHALMGLSLLRSGYVAHSVTELFQAFRLDPKEPLAYGAAAEIDYYEGRTRDSRVKAFQAHSLDSEEPDYLITIARASSRLEMFAEAADAYERFLVIAPKTDSERRDRIKGLIDFYRKLSGIKVHEVSGPPATQSPFKLGIDRRPYLKLKVNGRDATFVIDTGSGFTVISKDMAKRFGISEIAQGGNSEGIGGTGKFKIVYGLLKSLQIGDVKIRSIPCFIRPFHKVKDRHDEDVADGLIGLSVLSHFLTEIDYKDNVIRLNRNVGSLSPIAPSSNVTVVPFRTTQNGLISIETELDGNHRINAILDSAASSSVISAAAVERLNLRDSIIKGQTVQVIGAAGVSDNVELLFIRNCRVANLQQKNLRALILDFGAINQTSGFEQSGILGGDFLRHFRITIDFARAQVAFQPHTTAIIRQ